MKTKKHNFLFLGILCLMLFKSNAQNIKVVLMLGQSNMVGHGRVCDFNNSMNSWEVSKNSIPDFYFWGNIHNRGSDVQRWQNSNNKENHNTTYYNITEGFGVTKYRLGSEYGLAYQLKQNHPNTTFAFIKIAYGGKALGDHWKYPSGTGFGDIRTSFKRAIDAALPYVANIEIVGILWMQGESDAKPSFASNYDENLRDFIRGVRGLVQNYSYNNSTINRRYIRRSNVPFISGLITYGNTLKNANDNPCTRNYCVGNIPQPLYYLNHANTVTVRNAQKYCTEPNYGYIETNHLSRVCSSYDSPIHYDATGQVVMGIQFANKLRPYLTRLGIRKSPNTNNELIPILKEQLEITFYPNPTVDELHISFNGDRLKKEIKIYNIFNKVVKNIETELTDVDIDLSNIPEGNYFILIKENGKTILAKNLIKIDKE